MQEIDTGREQNTNPPPFHSQLKSPSPIPEIELHVYNKINWQKNTQSIAAAFEQSVLRKLKREACRTDNTLKRLTEPYRGVWIERGLFKEP